VLPTEERRSTLRHGRDILARLKKAGRLPAAQDWTAWFDDALATLDPSRPKAKQSRRRPRK
jgi:hypothetical protein